MGHGWAKFACVIAIGLFGTTLCLQETHKSIDKYHRELSKPSYLFQHVDWENIGSDNGEQVDDFVDYSCPAATASTKAVNCSTANAAFSRHLEFARLQSLPTEPLAVSAARTISGLMWQIKGAVTPRSDIVTTSGTNPRPVRALGV